MITVLIMNKEAFSGREYLNALIEAGVPPALIISIGKFEDPGNKLEIERTGGQWQPKSMQMLAEYASIPIAHVEKLNSKKMVKLLREQNCDIVISGGVGIIKKQLLSVPTIGILNVHPGRLPNYRGCTAPEWQIYYSDSVFATAHLVDEGVDTGPIVYEEEMLIDASWDYYDFRTNIYKHCAIVLIKALKKLEQGIQQEKVDCVLRYQDRNKGNYFSPINGKELERVKSFFKQKVQ